jgi:hypothetical protein
MVVGLKNIRAWNAREKRFLAYLVIVAAFAAWRFTPRYWKPDITLNSAHFEIATTANREQVGQVSERLEILYCAYSNRFSNLHGFEGGHPLLKVLLYKDRDEMRRVNPGLGWAEAFYRKPYCRAYFSAQETNPFHWMVHEATHQLNEEVAHLELSKSGWRRGWRSIFRRRGCGMVNFSWARRIRIRIRFGGWMKSRWSRIYRRIFRMGASFRCESSL